MMTQNMEFEEWKEAMDLGKGMSGLECDDLPACPLYSESGCLMLSLEQFPDGLDWDRVCYGLYQLRRRVKEVEEP